MSRVEVKIRLPDLVMKEYEMVAKLAGVSVASVMKIALAQEVRRQQWAAVCIADEATGATHDNR